MPEVNPEQAFARLTAENVSDKPMDLNLLDGCRHIFKTEYIMDLTRLGNYTETPLGQSLLARYEPKHYILIVGKGELHDSKPTFAGADWQLTLGEGGGLTNKSHAGEFHLLATEAVIKYIGTTSKTDEEITSIGSYFAQRIITLMLTTLFSKGKSGQRNTLTTVNTITANHSSRISCQKLQTNDHVHRSRSKDYVKSFRE